MRSQTPDTYDTNTWNIHISRKQSDLDHQNKTVTSYSQLLVLEHRKRAQWKGDVKLIKKDGVMTDALGRPPHILNSALK